MVYYPRNIEPALRRAVRQFRIVVLTGARQTGKSTLLQHLFRKSHAYVSLDNPKDLRLAQQDPELFFETHPGPLILDEIQYAPKLLTYLKLKVDKHQKRGEFLITGSQQFTMMKNLQETLAGRAVLFQLLPLAVSEGKISTQNYLFRALSGSYPEPVTIRGLDTERWFASYLATYIEKDVQLHYRLEKITHFRDFIFLLASRASQVLNCQSLSNDLGVSVSAVKLWIKILEASQIIYLLRPYHVNLGSRITKSPKVYFTDIGLVNFLVGNKDRGALLRGSQAGALFENFVIQETLKHFLNQGKTPPLYYYRTNNGLEVDLILEPKAHVIIPCEIKLTKTPHQGMLRSIERLRSLSKKSVSIMQGQLVSLINDDFYPLNRSGSAFSLKGFLDKLKI